MYAWRTTKGENIMNEYYSEKKKKMNWYECADAGMENELVLVYCVEETRIKEDTYLSFEDRYLQTLTASGKHCTGRISKWVKHAKENTYKQDGTLL